MILVLKVRNISTAILGFLLFFPILTSAEAASLTLARTIPLKGYAGSFDHFAYDAGGSRFFLAAEDRGTVEVFDLMTGAHLRSLFGFDKPHNIVMHPGSAAIMVVDSGDSKSRLLDAATYRTIKNIPLEIGANCTLYDPGRKRLYVTTGGDRVNRRISTLIEVDPDTGTVLRSLRLASIHLQPLALDAATNRLFVNLADRNAVAVVDRNTFRLLVQWPAGAATTNSAIAFDSAAHRLFVVGEPGAMVVMNSDTGKITDTVPVPANADDLSFDEQGHRLYIPGGDGFLGVYDSSDPDHVREIARIATRKEARTGLYIPQAHKYLLAAPEVAGEVAAVLIFDGS